MNKTNIKHFLTVLMLLMASRVIILFNDFLTATVLVIFAISVLTNETENDSSIWEKLPAIKKLNVLQKLTEIEKIIYSQ